MGLINNERMFVVVVQERGFWI